MSFSFQVPLLIFAAMLASQQALVRATEGTTLVAQWGFGTEEISRLRPHGKISQDQIGPRPPEFPDFDAQNMALKLNGDGGHYAIEDGGLNSPFDFTNGDAITLEAWVNVESIGANDYRYVVGKGRTGAKGFASDNQNWAMRVSGREGLVHLNFLFATEFSPDQTTSDAHWHRWTSTDGFLPDTGWHHIAITYEFGKPETIQGWIDGRLREGAWDMGGATIQAPVVDDDAVWIGSAQKGNPGNSFKGLLDEVAIHRGVLSAEVLRNRFRREGPERAEPQLVEAAPTLDDSKPGRIVFYARENLPSHDRWLKVSESSTPTAQWESDMFLLPRLPYRYDAWGIRDGWAPPVLVQAIGDVRLPAGNHRLMLRARGLSRLWIDEKVAIRTKPHSGSSDGHEPVQPIPDLPAPGHHAVGFGDQETMELLSIEREGNYRFILETMVGGKKLRAEPGEMLIAIQWEGSQTFEILTAAGSESSKWSLMEDSYQAAMKRANATLITHDDKVRRELASRQNAFWDHRHALAKDWVQTNASELDIQPSQVPIDSLIAAKIDRARSISSGSDLDEAKQFHDKVLPILREHCFRCHGDKVKGGLRLNSLEAAMRGGDSGEAVIVALHPEKSLLIQRMLDPDESQRMPPSGEPLPSEQIDVLAEWIRSGAKWPEAPVAESELALSPIVDDASFLRRVYLDTVGVSPSADEVRLFLAESSADKRERIIDQLLQDDRFADHWVSYWQDVLAENPNMLKPSLNNTGPFRYFLYEALRDNKAWDRLVTELIMMRGSEREGGSAGFGLAADNDAPMASKGHILASAFLGVELQCARCHDSPYHSTTQRDLFSLAAMLSRKAVTVPPTSTVAPGFFEKNKGRESLIQVTLKPGEPVAPEWPFGESIPTLVSDQLSPYVQDPKDSRERLAALLTAPHNERFAQVIVNRVWKRLMGAGFVEPAHDWEGRLISHPELLSWLARDFVQHGYDLRYLTRVVLNSQAYQRAALGNNLAATPEKRFFNAPDRRRLTAEQVADSLFSAAGQPMDVEEITFDPDGRRPASSMTNLGAPRRAWMFASLSNERDRPSLSLPKAQLMSDILEAFGWTGTRQNPRTDRETDSNVLQPGVLSNSPVISWITRASPNSELADLAVDAESPVALVDAVFLRFLARYPNAEERALYGSAMAEGFSHRLVPKDEQYMLPPPPRLARVSWSNHLVPEANRIKLEVERRAREGSPPDPRLRNDWRMVYEDFLWSIINAPEFVWVP